MAGNDDDPFGFFRGDQAPRPADPPAPWHRRCVLAARSVVALLALVTMLVAGLAWLAGSSADDEIAARQVDALAPIEQAAAGSNPPAAAAAPPVHGRPAENVLILGVDSREPGSDEPALATTQSDVLMIVHISAGGDRVDLLSIPRDLLVPAPTCQGWDSVSGELSAQPFVTDARQWLITNTYAVGGPTCTVKALQALSGVHIDRVVVMDFAGFQAIVDSVGGILMDFPAPVVDAGTTIIASAGPQTINGTQALALVRARHVEGDPTGDLGRIGRQQLVISAMLMQILSNQMLLDPVRLNAGLNSFIDNTRTDNMTFDDLANLVLAVKGTGSKVVGLHILPTVPSATVEGLVQGSGTETIFRSIIDDQPYPILPPGP